MERKKETNRQQFRRDCREKKNKHTKKERSGKRWKSVAGVFDTIEFSLSR